MEPPVSEPNQTREDLLDAFRTAMRHVAATVYAVTTGHGGGRYGILATAVSSLSFAPCAAGERRGVLRQRPRARQPRCGRAFHAAPSDGSFRGRRVGGEPRRAGARHGAVEPDLPAGALPRVRHPFH